MTRCSEIFKEEYEKTKEHDVHFIARARVICYLSRRYKTYAKHGNRVRKILNKID